MLTSKLLLIYNARVICMDNADTHAEAVLCSGDRILAVGRTEALRSLTGLPMRKVNLEGATLYPGFIDTHSHLDLLAAWTDYPYCGGQKDLAQTMAIFKDKARPVADRPLFAYGFDDTAIIDQRGPSRKELDKLFGERPAMLAHISLHAVYANSAMLRNMGIDPENPPRDDDIQTRNGQATGLLTELKAMAAMSRLPATTADSLAIGLPRAIATYNEQGFTSCIGGGLGLFGLNYGTLLNALGKMELEDKLNLRCNLPIISDKFEEALHAGLLAGKGSSHIRPHGMKILTDGAIQSYTAAIPEGYHNRPELRPEAVFSQRQMDEMVYMAHSSGQQLVVHGNGNGAIERAIIALERAQARYYRPNPHHMLVHCQLASDEQLKRMKGAGFEPTFFMLHIWNWGDRHRDIFLGPERAARLDPCGSAVRLGLPFGLHADTPVLPQMTLRSIQTAVSRKTASGQVLGEEQRVSPLEALRAYTVYAAGMCLDEQNRGSIEPGKLADFTILSRDPREVPTDEISEIQILGTVCGGRPGGEFFDWP